ncbi:MAG: methyltransferase domain-containing protein [Planctomycetota bacterium]
MQRMNEDADNPLECEEEEVMPQKEYDPNALRRYYEESMYNPLIAEFVGGSDFHNFGYWEDETLHHEQACRNLMDKLLSFFPDKPRALLDVACGKGATTRYLARFYEPCRVTGIDVSEKLITTAKKNAPGCTFLIMDAVNLQFDDESFDGIICVEAAFHFSSRQRFLKEASRVLKPGGLLVLTDTLVTRRAAARRIGRTHANHVDSISAYEDCLRQCGFSEVVVQDATRECWEGMYWGAVRFAHTKLLKGEIDAEELEQFLGPTYRRVPDMRNYLIVAARKGGAIGHG